MYNPDPSHRFADRISKLSGLTEKERRQIAVYGVELRDDPYERRTPITLVDRDPAVAQRILAVSTARPYNNFNCLIFRLPYLADDEAAALVGTITSGVASAIARQTAFLADVAASMAIDPRADDREAALLAQARSARTRSELLALREALKAHTDGVQLTSVARAALNSLTREISYHELWPNSENNEPLEPLMAQLLAEIGRQATEKVS